MDSVKGTLVVRGPVWKWGGKDGGEGSVGTVVKILDDSSELSQISSIMGSIVKSIPVLGHLISSFSKIPTEPRKIKMVTVIWDNGTKGDYRIGPEGAQDLLVVDSAATGVKHIDVPCHSCKMPDILGMRWQCLDCSANFCSICFYQIKELHNQHLRAYHRHDTPDSKPMPVHLDKETKLVELSGIFKGAKVKRGLDWYYGEEDEGRIGEVMKASSNKVKVKWPSGISFNYKRGAEGKVDLKVVKAAVGGHYDPQWLPIFGSKSPKREKETTDPRFTVADVVQVEVNLEEFQLKQADFGCWQPEMSKLISHIGTVCEIGVGTIAVQFEGSDRKWILNPAVLKKISKFSVGQIVRVKDDNETFKAMQLTLGKMSTLSLINKIGPIVSKSQSSRSEEKFYLELEDLRSKDAPMRPEWLEVVSVSTKLLDKFYRLKSDMVDLLTKAGGEGDLYHAQKLVTTHNVTVDAGRKVDGSTALHLACLNGHLSLIHWLLIEKKADLEKEDLKGRRALHYAVKGCQPEVLKLLIQRGAKLDPQTKKRKLSPLLKAVAKQFTDCALILIDSNCNINIQDDDGDTPLHTAVFSKLVLFQALLQCDRVDLTLKNKKGFNIFHAAVIAGNVPLVQLLLDRQESLALERVEGSQCSALHLACIKRDFQVVHLILARLKEKMMVDDVDREGQAALMKACREGHYGLIEFLVEMGADGTKVDPLVCILSPSQAIYVVFNCCNTTSSLTCAECYLCIKHCPYCSKPVESYQLNHQGHNQKDVTEEAANEHLVDHNYQKTIESSIAGLTIRGNSSEADASESEYVGNGDSSVISDVSPPKKEADSPSKQSPQVITGTAAVAAQEVIAHYVGDYVEHRSDEDELDDDIYLNDARSPPIVHVEATNAVPEVIAAQHSVERNCYKKTPISSAASAESYDLNVLKELSWPNAPSPTPIALQSGPVGASGPSQEQVEFLANVRLGLASAEQPIICRSGRSNRNGAYEMLDSLGNTYTRSDTGTAGSWQCSKKSDGSKNRCTATLFEKEGKFYARENHRCLK